MEKTKIAAAVAAIAGRHKVDVPEAMSAEDVLLAVAAKLAEPPKKHIIVVGGAEVDVSDLPALTIGDRKKLKGLGVDFMKYAREGKLDPDDESVMVLFLLQKRRAETTMAEVDELTALVSSSFLQFFMRKSAEVDDPFSTRSTSSQASTAGASAKLKLEPAQS